MMSREDILQELELLPVWQLRTPAANVTVETKSVQPEAAVAAVVAEEALVQAQPAETAHQFRLIMSEDAQWAFVLASQQSEEAEALLQNMIKAVSLSVGQDIVDANTAVLNQYAPKVMVVMGEAEVQKLLNEQQTLEQLRGKVHQHQNTPVIATYAPTYLLVNLADKAKAWEDLCLSIFTIASLSHGK